MKRIALIGSLVLAAVIALALFTAIEQGEKSPIFAEGTVELSPELASQAQGIGTLFIILSDPESPMPMPLGAMKERLSSDFVSPFSFTLTKEKMIMMRPDASMPKKLRIKARLDKDGVAGADQSGDLVGIIEGVDLGASDLKIRIDRRIE